MFPSREEFTEGERDLARLALELASDELGRECSSSPRSSDVVVGGRFVRNGVEYECVSRPSGLSFREGCSGCAFDKLKTCNAPRCSSFDREDGEFVWFVRV